MSARRPPPRKIGQGRGPRRIAGSVLDVAAVAREFGLTPKTVRARVARRLLPYRRWGGRIVFLRAELDSFLAGLPGVSVEQAMQSQADQGD